MPVHPARHKGANSKSKSGFSPIPRAKPLSYYACFFRLNIPSILRFTESGAAGNWQDRLLLLANLIRQSQSTLSCTIPPPKSTVPLIDIETHT
ncbi:hypothetical protein EmuJ_001187200 [Echinococcus multilocularis]|uniref:Uncharacterized protein n=1 Tax=Echinococcus multilocularis TaxID=6211 RepID=A0A068XUM2_ECHMU|nr:hypothetical protein EmuJ_001187200 [Echinococcus multilocularis]